MSKLVKLFVPAVSIVALAAGSRGQTPIYSYEGGQSGDVFGSAVCGVGDVDGDGVPDFATGAMGGAAGTTHNITVRSGASGAILYEFYGANGDRLGKSLCALGDVNQDGVPDFAAGANWGTFAGGPFQCGYVRVYSGADGSTLRTFYGSSAGEELGYSLANAGDLDGDGAAELIAGSFGSGARVLSARTGAELLHITGPAGHNLGWAVTSVGDFDGDGHDDLAVGAPQISVSAGYVNVYSGTNGALLTTLIGNPNRHRYGAALARLGDLDGDGVSELAVGSPYEILTPSTGLHGAVYVYSGAGGALFANFGAGNQDGYLGTAISGIADLNGDGIDDLLVGSPQGSELPTLQGPGMVQVYSGLNFNVIYTAGIAEPFSGFGGSIAPIGDFDGDGRPEWIAGGAASGRGHAIVFSGSPRPPSNYCTAKLNSLGCLPAMSYSGTPVLSSANNFHVLGTNVISHRVVFLYWSPEPDATPVFGGTRCVGGHGAWRTPLVNSGGTPGQTDCTGTLDFAFGYSYMLSKGLLPGCTIYAQYFYRDPGLPPPNGVGLTDGLRFTVLSP